MKVSRNWLLGLLTLSGISAVRADVVEDFYKGKTITLIVSTTAGSSYDLMGRTIAHHIGKFIPGNPQVIVRNQPGAGGITAANTLFRTAPKDGTIIAGLQGSVPFEPLLGTKEADFDASKFNWLGSPSTETCVLTIWGEAAAKSITMARQQEITVGSSGVNANPSFTARLLNSVLGTKLRLIYGYPGQPDVFLAMEKGEVDARFGWSWGSLKSRARNWLTEKKINVLVQMALQKAPDLPDVPLIMEFAKTDLDRKALELLFTPQVSAWPLIAPPDVPADRIDILRKAFDATMKDPAFIADAERLSIEVDPVDGATMQKLVQRIGTFDKSVIDRALELTDVK
jgi:tripartite-type tricarboxylate transporter receptor subunit TctC